MLPSIAISQGVRLAPSKPELKFITSIELKTGNNQTSFEHNTLDYKEKNDSVYSGILIEDNLIENAGTLEFKFAQLLDTAVEVIHDYELYAFVDQWLNTRYHFGGSTKNGIDCSGFSGELFKMVYGLKLPRTARQQYRASEKVDKDNMKEGDLVFFNTRGGVSHVGVYLMNGFFVHSSTKEGVKISHLDEEYYHRKFIGAGRISNEDYLLDSE